MTADRPPEESRDTSALNMKIDHVKPVSRDRSPRRVNLHALC
ncbi:MAG: hypothetical protein OJF62_001701 [Pseudolabrys sp.]|nr:hypothetical protein [Pseudolabrys sp.]